MAAVRGSGCTAAAPAGREPHLAHQPRDASTRMPQPFPAQLGVDAWRAVDPPAGGEDAADLRAQLGFRLGTALDGGDRVEPSVEAADARTDDSAQHGHGVVRPLGRYEGELRHAIPLAKKAAALRRISTSSSSRFTSRFSRCVSACSALRTASASAEPAAVGFASPPSFPPGVPGFVSKPSSPRGKSKLQMHQPAGGIIDEHQQRALRPTILKPPMLVAVDLNQLADAVAPRTGLVNPFQALLAVNPQPIRDHPLAQRLPSKSNPVQLAQLLRRQGRAEIPITLANDRQRRGPKLGGLAPVAGTTTPLRNQACRPLGAINLQKPKYLTPLKPQQLGRRYRRQPSLIQISQHLEPRKLLVAHQPYRHPRHLEKSSGVSSLSGIGVTF